MSIQFMNCCYSTKRNFQTYQYDLNNPSPYEQICQRYNEIEEWRSLSRYVDYQDEEPQITTPQATDNFTVAVVDYCDDSDSDIDLDGDGVGDMAHGNVVAHLIEATFRNSDVWTFDITQNSKYSTNERMIASLQTIVNELKDGSCQYDAVNLSLSSRITYSDLSAALGKNITKDNVAQYQQEIRNWLLTKGASNGYTTTAKVVQLLEEIESLGADVYIAAANVNDGTDDELNLYSIANNTTTVGANDRTGSKASFSFKNSLIDTWALGEIEVKKIKDSSGNLKGYDLNNDGVVDIDGSYTSGGKNSSNAYLRGTSFASPYRLIQELGASL